MSSKSRMTTAEEFCIAVKDGTHDSPKPSDKGRFLITSRHITSGKIDLSNAYLISEYDFIDINRRSKVDKWDVLLTMIGTVGEICLVRDEPNFAIKNIGLFKSKTELDGKWLYFYLRSAQAQQLIRGKLRGSTQQYIPLGDLRKLPITVPTDKLEMEAVVRTLSALDDKIELNNRINKTLEEMAQALFKRWFVDSEFPDETGQPYKSSGGEMEESELGPIPKGWKVESLDSIADYLNGLAMQKYRPEGEEFIPVIKIRELNQGKPDVQSDKASPNIDSKYIVNDGDVLFSWSGSLDVKIWCGGKGGLNQHLFKVTSVLYEKWFYYLWTKHHLEKFRGIAQDKATTMGHIQRKHLAESLVIVPAQEALERMNSVMRPIFDIFITREIEAATLVAISDTILPKLISGEIRLNGSFAEDIINGEG